MFNLFSADTPIMRFLEKVGNTIIVSLLWLLCSLPVITIGASTTALYFAVTRSVLDEGSVTKDFFHSFRQNFRQSLIPTLAGGVLLALLYLDLRILAVGEPDKTMQMLVGAAAFVTIAILSYLYPLLARFEWETTMELVKNAVLLSIGNLPKTVLIVILNASPMILLLWQTGIFLTLFPLLIGIWTGACARLIVHLLLPVFKKITPEETPALPE